jgi:hypothetical protein
MNQREMAMEERKAGRPLAFILGTNEIASAIAVHMHRAGWACVLSNDPFPLSDPPSDGLSRRLVRRPD